MTLFTIALYVIPIVLAVITVLIGIEGFKFYWSEVVLGSDDSDETDDARDG